MPRNPARVPTPLSERLSSTSSALLYRRGKEIDVGIGGLAFRLATSQELPQTIETVERRKEQLDVEAEPGEQSLSTWWRRSQESFHEGAGNLYQEHRNQPIPSAGFYDSRGVDPWSQGEVRLLRKMAKEEVQGTGHSRVRAYHASPLLSAVTNTALRTGDTPGGLADLHAPASKTVVDGFVAGSNFYTLCSDGTLYEGLLSSPGTASNWSTGSGATRMEFGKHRLWTINGRTIYQPDLTLASGSAQTALFTHPNQGWQYTCMAEGPQAMYFGGHDGRRSSIQAIALDADGGVPALTGAQVTATLPDGELVQELAVLAGQYVGIGTNKGFRVGVLDGTNIVYGPLLFSPDGVEECTAIATQDRFFLVAFATSQAGAEVWKVDTGTELEGGIFPYARSVELDNGSVTSLAVWGDDQVVATDSDGYVWGQSATELVESGYLHTGRIRFRTSERKLFKYIELDTEPLAGSIQVAGYSETDSRFDIVTVSQPGEAGTDPLPITTTLGPQRFISLKFTLARSTSDSTQGPVIRSYLLRAMPSSKPQRLITLPLLCFDREQGHSGMRYGYEGFASDRLQALQDLEDGGDSVIYQDFGLLDGTGQVVVIENMRFVQTAAHTKANASGRGGILIVQLRTVTA